MPAAESAQTPSLESMMPTSFDHILNWKLLKGSHDFPGSDGGTCINEAAIIAAGLPYKKVGSAEDCPPCFSRPLAAYALVLNDAMPDAERPRLMAFVLRLSGSADTPEIEAERTAYIVVQTVRRILPIALRAAGLVNHAEKCALVETLGEAREAASAAAARAAEAAAAAEAWAAAARAAEAAAAEAWAEAARAAEAAAEAWPESCAILDEALKIGRQAPAIETVIALERLEASKGHRLVPAEAR